MFLFLCPIPSSYLFLSLYQSRRWEEEERREVLSTVICNQGNGQTPSFYETVAPTHDALMDTSMAILYCSNVAVTWTLYCSNVALTSTLYCSNVALTSTLYCSIVALTSTLCCSNVAVTSTLTPKEPFRSQASPCTTRGRPNHTTMCLSPSNTLPPTPNHTSDIIPLILPTRI